MSDLVVIVPSRGRPGNIRRLSDAWNDTAATADLVVAVDDDDPTLNDYLIDSARFLLALGVRAGLAGTLNEQAVKRAEDYRYVGFMGDDHCPRTPGWDKRITDTLDELGTGLCYGNDLFQGPRLPTAVFVTADIITTLGYLCPPGFRHLFLDDCWKAWGAGLDRLRYLPDVIIEHIHPQAGGKAEWDDGYREVNGPEMWQSDGDAWNAYRADTLDRDLDKLRALL